MCVSTTYFYGPTIQKKLPKSDEKNLKENGRERIASDQKKRSRKTVTSSKIIKCTEKDLKL